MADKITIDLIGDVEVMAALKELKEELPKDPLRKAVREAAKFLLGFIVAVEPELTGRLKRNTRIRTRKTAHTVRARVVVNMSGGRDSPDNAFYWRFLEKGWHTASGAFHQFPFVGAVFNSKGSAAAQTVIDSCEKQVAKAQARIARAAGNK